MDIIDAHFHWLPRSILEKLMARTEYPIIPSVNARGGYDYIGGPDRGAPLSSWAEWHDLDEQFAYLDSLGHYFTAVNSFGPSAVMFSDLPTDAGREISIEWNEEMAAAQKRYPGRFYSSAAIPLRDTTVALEVLDDAIARLGLMGVSLPATVGADARIDAKRLEPFFTRVEELGIPLFMHPADAVFSGMLSDDYDGALHLSLGRVFEISAAATRLIFSGVMERHPKLKLVVSHAGGDIAYQATRIDKYNRLVKLPQAPSVYMRRMFTDTAVPDVKSLKLAIEFFGLDNFMYGSDYPCCDPQPVLDAIDELGLSSGDLHNLFYANAVRILGLKNVGSQRVPVAAGA
jgi:aminocarboxymuconate-semialdehyde decarboxylase